MLVEKLDVHFNGEHSVVAQKERFLSEKSIEQKRRTEKRNEMKRRYKDILMKADHSLDKPEN